MRGSMSGAACSTLARQRGSRPLSLSVLCTCLALSRGAAAQAASEGTNGDEGCRPACRTGYVCIERQCVSACNPPCGAGEVCTEGGECRGAAASTAVAAVVIIEPRSGAVFRFNSLGVLQFGLDPTLEFGSRTSFWVRLRAMNSGLLSYIIAADPSDDEKFVLGLGGSLGFRRYSGMGMWGGYWGAAFEYVYTHVEDTEDDLAVYKDHGVIPQFESGYRWPLGTSFNLDVGAALGVYVPVGHTDEPSEAGGCVYEDSCDGKRESSFYGLLNLGLGWNL